MEDTYACMMGNQTLWTMSGFLSNCIYLEEKLEMQEMAEGDPWTSRIILEELYLALCKVHEKDTYSFTE